MKQIESRKLFSATGVEKIKKIELVKQFYKMKN